MTTKLSKINFNDIPGDIKLKIYNINKEDQKKNEYQIYTHLKGKFIIYRERRTFANFRGEDVVGNSWNFKLQKQVPYQIMWNWINCVGCGCDTSKRRSTLYHACYNCWSKGKYKRIDQRCVAPIALHHGQYPVLRKTSTKGLQPVIADEIFGCLID